uniref:Uncharacterized protein n=1 Tax=Mesocestoides corti TaxID=53468 RepID=A0A5K3EMY2_MESCO
MRTANRKKSDLSEFRTFSDSGRVTANSMSTHTHTAIDIRARNACAARMCAGTCEHGKPRRSATQITRALLSPTPHLTVKIGDLSQKQRQTKKGLNSSLY